MRELLNAMVNSGHSPDAQAQNVALLARFFLKNPDFLSSFEIPANPLEAGMADGAGMPDSPADA